MELYKYETNIKHLLPEWRNRQTKEETKMCTFWDITPSSPLKVTRCFGGEYRLHLHYRRIGPARKQRVAGIKQILRKNCYEYILRINKSRVPKMLLNYTPEEDQEDPRQDGKGY
jgi:hypothetical protein